MHAYCCIVGLGKKVFAPKIGSLGGLFSRFERYEKS